MASAGTFNAITSKDAWRMRLAADRDRAANQPAPRRQAWGAVLDRAIAEGARAFAMTGSTVRARRTALSDLDFMLVGPRADLGDLREDVDVCAIAAADFWSRLEDGDDYILWTLRFGWILHDDGVLRAAAEHVERTGLAPSASRKLIQARRGLRLAGMVLASGDLEAAREQCRSALTIVARWVLIADGDFPLSRDELAEQLAAHDHMDLAIALHATIHAAPSADELAASLAIAERLTAAAAASARCPASAGL